MIVDKFVNIIVQSSKTIGKLNELNIKSKIGDKILLPIELLWNGSNIKIKVKCDICGNEKDLKYTYYLLNIKNHNIYCCNNSCAQIKNKMTNLERYGDENYHNTDKIKKTCIDKYGVENVLSNKYIQEKAKQTKIDKYNDVNFNNREKYKKTCLDKYGVENVINSVIFREKVKQTNLEKYGTEYVMSNKEIREKAKQTKIDKYNDVNFNNRLKYKETCLEKYGVDSTNKVLDIKKKKVISQLNKYGFISNSMSLECKEKLKKTNIERYGVEFVMQHKEFFDKQQKSSLSIKKYKNTTLYYQGTYELNFLEYSEKINILNLIKRGEPIKYEYLGKNKIYYPDFHINEYNLIIEIKSSYLYNKYIDMNESKKNQCISDGYNYIIIIDKNYNLFDLILNEI
jgi:hypothetical protein